MTLRIREKTKPAKLSSLITNVKKSSQRFYVICYGFSQKNQQKIEKSAPYTKLRESQRVKRKDVVVVVILHLRPTIDDRKCGNG